MVLSLKAAWHRRATDQPAHSVQAITLNRNDYSTQLSSSIQTVPRTSFTSAARKEVTGHSR